MSDRLEALPGEISAALTTSTSLDGLTSLLKEMLEVVNEQTKALKAQDERTAETSRAVSTLREELTSLQRGSTSNDVGARLSEIEKTLVELARTVSDERVVKLPGGGSVTAEQLKASNLVGVVIRKLETMGLSFNELSRGVDDHTRSIEGLSGSFDALARQVRERGTIHVDVDTDKVSRSVEGVLGKHLERTVSTSVGRVARSMGSAVRDCGEYAKRVEAAAKRLEASRRLGWPEVGRLAAALMPMVVALLLVVGVGRVVVVDVLGLPTLTGYLWSRVVGAASWWATGGWLTLLLMVLGATGAAIVWVGGMVREWYRSG